MMKTQEIRCLVKCITSLYYSIEENYINKLTLFLGNWNEASKFNIRPLSQVLWVQMNKTNLNLGETRSKIFNF